MRARDAMLLAAVAVAARAGAQPAAPRWAAAVDSMMAREMAAAGAPGAQIAVVDRGRLVYTKGYGVADMETGRRVDQRTLFQVGSVSKLFTSMLLAELASRGVVDLRVPVSRYVPELAGRQPGSVTVHEPTPAERAALVGEYRRPRNPTLEIREVDGRLVLRRPTHDAPIRMTGADRFRATAPNGPASEYAVVRDSAGAVRYLQAAAEVVFLRSPIP